MVWYEMENLQIKSKRLILLSLCYVAALQNKINKNTISPTENPTICSVPHAHMFPISHTHVSCKHQMLKSVSEYPQLLMQHL